MMRHANDMPNLLDILLAKSSLAERHVRECREVVERQRALVARYKAAGLDASSSEVLLGEIQHSLDFFENHYRSIQVELEALRGGRPAQPNQQQAVFPTGSRLFGRPLSP